MSIKSNSLPQPRGFQVDAAVEAAMTPSDQDPVYGSIERRQRARNQTSSQRKKAERDRNRSKVTYDLPQELIHQIRQAAETEEIPPSHLVGVLISMGLDAWESGAIDLSSYKRPSRNARYVWFLDIFAYKRNRDLQ